MTKQWDIFISHASEDKGSFVNELSKSLLNKGLSIWYDDFELKIGSKIRESIEDGLSNSIYGVIIISNHFIKKDWTVKELDGLFSMNKKILPIWHNITKKEIATFSPLLLNTFALDSSKGPESIAREIELVVSSQKNPKPSITPVLETSIKTNLPFNGKKDPYGLGKKTKAYSEKWDSPWHRKLIFSATEYPTIHTVGEGGESSIVYELLDLNKNVLFQINEHYSYYTPWDETYGFPSPTTVVISAVRPGFDDLILECNDIINRVNESK